MIQKIFKLKENGTTVSTELLAGLTTFFAMAYVIFVIPSIVVQAGTADNPMPYGAVFLATIIASAGSTLFMALFANVPYALAPGLGLASFMAFTVCTSMGFTWQEALGLVFLCSLLNIMITLTNIRKMILISIPESLQSAIGGGIGIFIAYIGIKNAGFLTFTSDPNTYTIADSGTMVAGGSIVPSLSIFNNAGIILALIGLIILTVLMVCKVKNAILLAIIITTIMGIPLGVVDISQIMNHTSVSGTFSQLGDTIGVAFGKDGLLSLFRDPARVPLVIITVFAFSLSDMFDTIGVFLGTSKKAGIFPEEDLKKMMEKGNRRTKLERALFSDAIGTFLGSIFGASNVTTYLESTAGIGAGGRTGLTSVTTALLFLVSMFLSPVVAIVPSQATAPVLIMVGIMMLSSFKDIDWSEISEAIPAFFTGIFMALCYNISYGIACGFIFYCIVKICQGKTRQVNVVIWVCTALFLVNFAIMALL